MRIISKRRLLEYSARYPDGRASLEAWHQIARHADWQSLADVRKVYRHADVVGNKTVFNIKGNAYRLITAIHYNRGRISIRELLTHAEYDKGDWKQR